MDPWAEVRLRARACHADALTEAGGDRSAVAIVTTAARLRDIEIVPFEPGTRFDHGILGVYERVGPMISVDASLREGRREIVIAHEIGHHELGDDAVAEVTSVDAAPGVAARIVGYTHRERREMAADVFAVEFLCPADWLRVELVDRGRRPSEVARELGLPSHVVAKQGVRAVCLPPLRAAAPRSSDRHPLDPAQTEAATWDGGALLVEAGPGTGKTATLVGRIVHLLDAGVAPSRLLVLTYSTRAAAELRARVADAAPEAAGALWIGTIHSFGLEVCHAWHFRVGRSPRPRVLDRDGSLELLERHLDALPLAIFRDLRDPAVGLSPVLRAIERCKDELVTAEDYAAATRAAAFDGEGEAVAIAEEVAAVYAVYQRLLDEEDALDLGDLVAVAARLLGEHDDVAAHYGDRFAHVLVDEVQDANHAATRLLQSLGGPGTTLWAVGDGRQSIYRFRGADPTAVADFADAFGGTTMALDRTYRATPEIVGAFEAFSGIMAQGRGSWTAQRPSGAPVRLLSAPTLAGEVSAIRDRIEELRSEGIGYGDQAVLARTHRVLERIGAGLERHGVPISYLGDLFTRDEVRNLLAVVSIDAEPGGLGLLRIATRPPYDVPRSDVLAVISWAATEGKTVSEALRRARTIPDVEAGAARRLALLGRHLAAAGPAATAWTAMTTWLCETHGAAMLADDAAPSMRRVAVYQLLRLAAEEGTGRRDFIARIRRIASLGGGRDHGVVAPEAQPDDAVRLMTIHGAKGLEWSAVHLPMASSRHVPLMHRRDACPPPPDLARLAMSSTDHDAEERALWFVALSRARDSLTISHAQRYGDARDARPSPFLGHVGNVDVRRHHDPGVAEPAVQPNSQPPRATYPTAELDTWLRCPARYGYDIVDGLGRASPPSAHRRMMTAVLAAMRQIEGAAASGTPPTYEDGGIALSAAWSTDGPVGHRHERHYRDSADHLIARLTEIVATEVGAIHHRPRWVVDVGTGNVAVRPHRVVEHPWGAVTVQIVGARRRDQQHVAGLVAALSIGARAAFPDTRVGIEIVDPDDGEVIEAELVDDESVIERYRDAITGIERGDLAPRPDPRRCPACPFFLICGA